MSNWKVDVKHRYMYVERYIDYIEPLIIERMQGVEDWLVYKDSLNNVQRL